MPAVAADCETGRVGSDLGHAGELADRGGGHLNVPGAGVWQKEAEQSDAVLDGE